MDIHGQIVSNKRMGVQASRFVAKRILCKTRKSVSAPEKMLYITETGTSTTNKLF
jgi:hypothetical protein